MRVNNQATTTLKNSGTLRQIYQFQYHFLKIDIEKDYYAKDELL